MPPDANTVMRSETELVLATYRTQLLNPADLDNVKKVQAGYKVAAALGVPRQPAPAPAPAIAFIAPLTPGDAQNSLQFFNILNFVLTLCPTVPSERALMERFARIGVGAGKTIDASTLAPDIKQALEQGMADAWKEYEDFKATQIDTGKVTSGDLFGTRDLLKNNYLYRMTAAILGLYGNSKAEAMYPAYTLDGAHQKLEPRRAVTHCASRRANSSRSMRSGQ